MENLNHSPEILSQLSAKVKEINYYTLDTEKLKRWDYIRNINKNPHQIPLNSIDKFWWNCSKCGNIYFKQINSNCEKCYNLVHFSVPEMKLLYLFVTVFGKENVASPFKLSYGRSEIDIFLPKINLGIEYDGVNFHRSPDRQEQDVIKNDYCNKNGYTLIRIREEGLEKLSDTDIVYNHKISSNFNLKEPFLKIIDFIKNDYGLSEEEENNLNSIKDYDSILIPDDIFDIRNDLVLENPISKSHPVIAASFISEKNLPLKIDKLSPGMSHRCWWTCLNCNKEFHQTIVNNIKHDGICLTCRTPLVQDTSEKTIDETEVISNIAPNQNETRIVFDENSPNEFDVLFTTRGFLVGKTRMSFEELENAISKKYTIILKTGLVLDVLKMNKILLYRQSLLKQKHF